MSDYLSVGRLEDHPFAELSGLIFQESRTGELTLESGNHRRTVWFLGGNPVAVVSDDPQDHLAQFLLEHGKIGNDDANRLAVLPETREALGSADFLPKELLNWGVKSRFVNLCYDLFRWEDGDYVFHEGDPPRELFLLKVPAHSLIFKGVGLLGQAAVIDAVPDDAVCGAGPVAPDDARYLSTEAHRLLERCAPGRTVAEALGGAPADLDQARRLLYALTCLGLVTLQRGPALDLFEAPVLEEGPGFILDDDADAAGPAPDFGEPPAQQEPPGFSPQEQELEHTSGEFALHLPPLVDDYGSAPAPVSDFHPAETVQPPGGYPFEDEQGPGSLGSFGPDTSFDSPDDFAAPADESPEVPNEDSKRSGRRFHLPRIAGIAIGALAAAGIVALAGWWWMSGNEPPPPAVKPPVKQPAPVVATPAAPAQNTEAVVPAPAPTPPSPAPAPDTVDSAPRPSVSSGASGTDRYGTALEIFRAGDLAGAAAVWETILAEEHRGAFTVQVLTACQLDTVQAAQRSLSAQNLYLVTKKVNGRTCYRICLGTFDSREAAGRALSGMPGEYRSGGASVRPVADVLDRDH